AGARVGGRDRSRSVMKSLSEANGSSTIRVRGNGEQPTSDDGGHNGKQLFHVFSCALASPHVRLNAATSQAHTAGRRRVAANTRVDCEQRELVGTGRLALEQHVAERRPPGAVGHAKGVEPHAQWDILACRAAVDCLTANRRATPCDARPPWMPQTPKVSAA